MFQIIDKNDDGVIDQTERDEHMNKMMGYMKERMYGADKKNGASE